MWGHPPPRECGICLGSLSSGSGGDVTVLKVRGLETLVQSLWRGDSLSEKGSFSKIGVLATSVARRRRALVR